ncbi:MAG: hypothetical protein JW850_23970 [Thermoflexales bacterium]|nr:hypothetical protein [Thermoflexales bacterium]
MHQKSQVLASWLARAAVGLVFAWNVACAVSFILQPDNYAAAFELTGVPGRTVVQGFGILFLMWNATYPPVLFRPGAHRTLFAVILVQQLIGVAGEMGLWLELPAGHPALAATGQRFILFDGAGLLLMGAAYVLLRKRC